MESVDTGPPCTHPQARPPSFAGPLSRDALHGVCTCPCVCECALPAAAVACWLCCETLEPQGPWVAERLAAIKPFFDAHAEEMHPVTRAITAGGANFSAVDTFEAQYSVLRKGRVANEVWRHADVLLVPTSGTIYTLAQVAENPVQLNSNLVTWVALVVKHFHTTRVTCRDMRRVTRSS